MIKVKKLFFFLGLFFVLVFVVFYVWLNDNKNRKDLGIDEELLVPSFLNLSLGEVERIAKDNDIILDIKYQYSYDVEKDRVIFQSLEVGSNFSSGDSCIIYVSKGEVPVELYKEFKVNELGKVPIMMYHGIVDMKDEDTEYIGGNIDRDGYNRTVESFRDDLEFYYQKGYRMIRLIDYVNGIIDVELGYSPIILTFDDGNENNFRVIGEENGELLIDPNCAVGVLEEFKKKYPDYGVTATFFVNEGLFQQEKYNEKILKWLVSHGYDIGNHTMNHVDFTKVDIERTQEEIGGVYQVLDKIIPSKYVPIVALPFGSPYNRNHFNYEFILRGKYLGVEYVTRSSLRVGWESEVSCFHKDFQPQFLKRIRAYDNLGKDFDIKYNFKILEDSRYISDGDKDTVVFIDKDKDNLGNTTKRVRTY